MPAEAMTFRQRWLSSANNAAVCAGDCPPGVVDIAFKRFTTSGIRRTSLIAEDSLLTGDLGRSFWRRNDGEPTRVDDARIHFCDRGYFGKFWNALFGANRKHPKPAVLDVR
jgi:hypothetical protein